LAGINTARYDSLRAKTAPAAALGPACNQKGRSSEKKEGQPAGPAGRISRSGMPSHRSPPLTSITLSRWSRQQSSREKRTLISRSSRRLKRRGNYS
jgi:hypothetical protein